jgi:hypothetical protein
MAVTTDALPAAAARAAAGDHVEAPGLDDATSAPGDDGGPFVIVTGSGDRVPGCPEYQDKAAAARACDRANRRAALTAREAAYQIAPAHAAAPLAQPPGQPR